MSGLELTPLLRKRWRVADIQGHRNPWNKDLLDLSIPQLDAICELYGEDNPTTFRFWRNQEKRPTKNLADWAGRLTGAAALAFLHRGMPPALIAAMKARRDAAAAAAAQKASQVERTGFHKGGQKIPPPSSEKS